MNGWHFKERVTHLRNVSLPERLSIKAQMRQLRIPAYVKLALRNEIVNSEKALFERK